MNDDNLFAMSDEGGICTYKLLRANIRSQLVNLKSGDLILFSGDYLISKVIMAVSNSSKSHIGIVVVIKGVYYIFESRPKTGVSLLPLINRLKHYRQLKLTYRNLFCPDKLRTKIQDIAIKTIKENEGKSYQKNYFEMCFSIFNPFTNCCCRPKRPNKDFFCSELVARVLIDCGLLRGARSATMYSPGDFSEKSELIEGSGHILMIEGCSYGPEIALDRFDFIV